MTFRIYDRYLSDEIFIRSQCDVLSSFSIGYSRKNTHIPTSVVRHPILRRSFCTVLRLYTNTPPLSNFLVKPLSACYGLFVILPCFKIPYRYVHCHGNLVFVLHKYSTLSKIQHPNISSIIFTFFSYFSSVKCTLPICNAVITLWLLLSSLCFSMHWFFT